MKAKGVLCVLAAVGFFFLVTPLKADELLARHLLEAVLKEDLGYLQQFKELNPNHTAVAFTSIICPAVELGNHTVIAFLIREGADVNHKNDEGMTPLDIAADWCDYGSIEMLVSNGADMASRKRAWMTVQAIKAVFQMRNISVAQKTRDGVTRRITLNDIELSISTPDRLGVGVDG